MNIMKKIFGVMVISTMFFSGVIAVSGATLCNNIPESVLIQWTNLSPEAQQAYSDSYCSSGGSLGGTQANPTTGGSLGGTSVGLSASTKLQNPIKYSTFSQFAAAVTKTAVQVLMPFIVLAFIYSGFLFVKAQGNVEELKTAKTTIIYSMIGAFILLGAWGFAQIIGQTVSTLTQ